MTKRKPISNNPLVDLLKFMVQFFTVKMKVSHYGFLVALVGTWFAIHSEIQSSHKETKTAISTESVKRSYKSDSILNIVKDIQRDIKEMKDTIN